jgi:hypothetical protein
MFAHLEEKVSQDLDMGAFFKRIRNGRERRHRPPEQSIVLRDTDETQVHTAVNLPISNMDSQDAEKYGLLPVAVPKSAEIDIIFIHELHGHRRNTWTRGTNNSSCFSPEELLAKDLPNARIMTWGYDSDVIRRLKCVSLAILGQHAENLCTELRNERKDVPADRLTLFIAHSMGGIVTKGALLKSHRSNEETIKSISDNTCGLAFTGTPHLGSNDVNVGYFFVYLFGILHQTNISPLEELKKDAPSLDTLERNFIGLLHSRLAARSSVKIVYFCESLPLSDIVGIAHGTQELVSKGRRYHLTVSC